MKNVLAYYDPDFKVQIEEDAPIPRYGEDEVLIRVHVTSSNPKDWKHPHPNYFNVKLNQGDDCAGIISAVGSKVRNFKVGDRVAGFHEMDTPRGTYAEFTVCPANTVFHIPESLSFEEASTIPLAAFTAAVGIWRNLGLPVPGISRIDEKAAGEKPTVVVNGASGAVGAFVVKLLKASGAVGKVIGIAGASGDFVTQCGADAVLDYRSPTIAQDLDKALDGKKVRYVFDASNSIASVTYLTSVMEEGGRYTATTRITPHPMYPDAGKQDEILTKAKVWRGQIWVGSVHDNKPARGTMFGAIVSRIIESLLETGELTGHPFEVVPGGLTGVDGGLRKLMARKGGDNKKLVYRIDETPGFTPSS